jgi:hypothetical protein
MIVCWSRYVREPRTDLETARGRPDEEVLEFDLCVADAHLDELLAILREQARPA